MVIYSAVNLKGGVGKTSCCFHLCGAFAQTGHRILAVDADPQSSLTAGFYGPAESRLLDPVGTIQAVFAGEDPHPEQVIRPTGVKGIDLLAGSRFAGVFNNAEPHKAPYSLQAALREFLDQVAGAYDIALIDCPPNLHLCSWAAMAAAHEMIVPVQPEDWGCQGTADVLESAELVRQVINPGLAPALFVVSMFQSRRAVHQTFVQGLRQLFGGRVLEAMVPEAVDFVEAVTNRQPIGFYKPRGAGAKAVRAVAEELMARLAARSAGAGEAA
jgi:chromosome partitioning protein